mgnify:CR=1 FL=1
MPKAYSDDLRHRVAAAVLSGDRGGTVAMRHGDDVGAELTLRAGPVMHRADSDVFDFFRSELTLDRGDFRAPSLSGELGLYLHRRVDLVLGGGWSKTESQSESRDFVEEGPDGSDMPIEQVLALPPERLPPEEKSEALLTRARDHYDRAIAAQRSGDWATYGTELRRLGELLRQEDAASELPR